MKKMILRGVVGVLIAVIMVGIGYLHGSNNVKVVKEIVRIKDDSQEELMEFNETIAIINLDEGVTKNREKVNYGSSLTNLLSNNINFKTTGLEDGRQGIINGVYSAYIIIPNTFSESIETISTKPEKAVVAYAIATELGGQDREDTIERIREIYNSYTSNVSQVYISSMLKDIHTVQDSALSIMNRDTKDMELLLSIEGYNLIEIVSIPEIQTVENTVTPFDSQAGISTISSAISDMNNAYSDSLSIGQGNYNVIKDSSSDVLSSISAVDSLMSTVNANASSIAGAYTDENETTEDINFTAIKDNILADPGGILPTYNEDLLNTYNYTVGKLDEFQANESYLDMVWSEINSKMDYSGMSSGFAGPNGQTGTTDEYLFYTIDQYNALIDEFTYMYETEYGPGADEYLAGILPGYNVPTTLTINTLNEYVNFDYLQLDLLANGMDNTLVEAEVDALIELGKAARTTRVSELQVLYDGINVLKTDILNLDTSYNEMTSKQNSLDDGINSFDMLSYVDYSLVSSYNEEMGEANSSIATGVSEYASQTMEFITNINESTGNNILNIQTSIQEAQENSQVKLESELLAAKNSRAISNGENLAVLNDITLKLPYTRVGEIANREVYSFMSSPFLLDNMSVSADTTSEIEEIDTPSNINTTQEESGNNWWLLVVGIIIVLTLSVLAFVLSMKRSSKRRR
ncbi:MAG: hypothetical protein ACK5LL_14910 [Suipraeoptans sp.]